MSLDIPLSQVGDAVKFIDPSLEQLEIVDRALSDLAQLFFHAQTCGWEPLDRKDAEAVDAFVEDQLHIHAEIAALLAEEEERMR